MNTDALIRDERFFKELRDKVLAEPQPVLIYGAGYLGKMLLTMLRLYDMDAACFCDNAPSKQGTLVEGIPVSGHAYCVKTFGKAAVWLIANFQSGLSISQRLEADGIMPGVHQWSASRLINYSAPLELVDAQFQAAQSKPIIFAGNPGLALRIAQSQPHFQQNGRWIYCITPAETELSALDERFECCTPDACKLRFPEALYVLSYKPLCYPADGRRLPQDKTVAFLTAHGISSKHMLGAEFFLLKLRFASAIPEQAGAAPTKTITQLQIKHFQKILLYESLAVNGCVFFNSVMDFHPNILFLGYSQFTANILFFIWQVQHAPKREIPRRLLDLFERQMQLEYPEWGYQTKQLFPDVDRFEAAFLNALDGIDRPTDRDLFIATHIAHFYMLGRTYHADVLPVLYLEAHCNAPALPLLSAWFQANFETSISCQLVRNTLMVAGASLRLADGTSAHWKRMLPILLQGGLAQELAGIQSAQRLKLRFEDLKLHPKETLSPLCDALEIPWADTFLETTNLGQPYAYRANSAVSAVSGYDLKPVYNQNDEFFSSFDRFRLDLLFRARQKAYGYPTIRMEDYGFTKEQLSQWFQMPFKLEHQMEFASKEERDAYRQDLYDLCMTVLEMLERQDQYPEYFEFEPYMRIK